MLDIRTFTVADAEQFVALRRMALITDQAAFPWSADEDPNSKIEVVRGRLSSAKPTDGPFIVGAFDADLVGVVGVIRASEDAARLWGMYVRRDKRRKGTGRFLLREILRLARGLPDVKEIVLSVARSEEPAIRLYTRVGFRTNSEDQGSLHMVLDVGGGAVCADDEN